MRPTVCVLIPTFGRRETEILSLCHALHVAGRVLVSNQCGEDAVRLLDDRTQLINSASIGVSANRNVLLRHTNGDFNIFIDDDCLLCDGYEQIIIDAFSEHPDAEAILFSRDSNDDMFGPLCLKNKKVRRFSDISALGAPGIAIRKEAISKHCLSFNERLGTPNYFFNGEDSAFLMQMVRKKVIMYTSSIPLFTLLSSQRPSSYFAGYDRHFFESIGGVHYYLHRFLFLLYHIKRAAYYRKKTGASFVALLGHMSRGKKKMKLALRSGEISRD